MTLRLAFMGTPGFSVPTLAGIVAAGHQVVAVYSQPPRAAGRGMDLRQSPVHEFAEAHGIEVRSPVNFQDAVTRDEFAGLGLDAAIVVAYGLILPQAILDAPKYGCFNLHGSILPRWRGAAPIQRAIMAGDEKTGAMVMRMEAGLDTGPVCLGEEVAIGTNMTAGELHDVLAATGGGLMARALVALERGSLTCEPQAGDGITYAKKIEKPESRIDWSWTADEVHNHIRGLSPFPGAWFEFPAAKGPVRVKALRSTLVIRSGQPGQILDGLTIACADGAVQLTQVQRSGKGPMVAEDFLRGASLEPGAVLL